MYTFDTFAGERSVMRQAVITARVDSETAARIDEIAQRTGRTRSWLAAQAIRSYAEREAAFLAFIKEGEDAIARGDVLSEEEMDGEFDRMLADLGE
jgi:predicted transcriptional regulator